MKVEYDTLQMFNLLEKVCSLYYTLRLNSDEILKSLAFGITDDVDIDEVQVEDEHLSSLGISYIEKIESLEDKDLVTLDVNCFVDFFTWDVKELYDELNLIYHRLNIEKTKLHISDSELYKVNSVWPIYLDSGKIKKDKKLYLINYQLLLFIPEYRWLLYSVLESQYNCKLVLGQMVIIDYNIYIYNA